MYNYLRVVAPKHFPTSTHISGLFGGSMQIKVQAIIKAHNQHTHSRTHSGGADTAV